MAVLKPSKERPALCKANFRPRDSDIQPLTGVDLSGANLQEADFTGVHLLKAKLGGADLAGATFTRAKLDSVNFDESKLYDARFDDATLTRVTLRKAVLLGTDFTGAVLKDTDFTGATLPFTRFTRASLFGTDFSSTTWIRVYLAAAAFEPKASSLDSVVGIESSEGLALMNYRESHAALVALRKKFIEAGFRDQERQVTFAKLRAQQNHRSIGDNYFWQWFEATFSYLAFDFTCAYGLYYGRPLKLLGALVVLMAGVYAIALGSPGRGGIWRVWALDRIRQDEGLPGSIRLSWGKPQWPGGPQRRLLYRVCRALGLGLLFSLLSSFQIGWRELNVGNWISRVQPREYTLRATGWVRVVAGIQSLLSVYLLALWALTYFGRPFE